MGKIKITASGKSIKWQVSSDNVLVNIHCGGGNEVDIDVQAFLKGEKGDTGVGFIPLNGGYTLPSQAVDGQSLIIMIETVINSVQLVMHPGPDPVGPIHVFGPNSPKWSWIKVIYAFGRWIKIAQGFNNN